MPISVAAVYNAPFAREKYFPTALAKAKAASVWPEGNEKSFKVLIIGNISASKSYGRTRANMGFRMRLPIKRHIIRDIAAQIPDLRVLGNINKMSVMTIQIAPLFPSVVINVNTMSSKLHDNRECMYLRISASK